MIKRQNILLDIEIKRNCLTTSWQQQKMENGFNYR